MATVKEALEQLKAILLTASVVGQPALTAGYVYPDEFATMPAPFQMPCVVVSELVNSLNSMERKAAGLAIHRWRAEVLLFVAPELLTLNADSAAAELKTRGWAQAFAAKLWANQSLNGTAHAIGDHTGEMPRLFEYMVGHVHWDTVAYWGLRIELPVRQLHAQEMKAQ